MSTKTQELLDEYYRHTGKLGLLSMKPYSEEFVEWLIRQLPARPEETKPISQLRKNAIKTAPVADCCKIGLLK